MQAIHDEQTWQMFLAERAFLKAIGGGCNEAAAVDTAVDEEKMTVRARYAADGAHMKEISVSGTRYGDRLIWDVGQPKSFRAARSI